MCLWYHYAQVCYAYLADVPGGDDHQSEASEFARSRWFTRGWTLQELLAPSRLVFYGKDWREIGTRTSLLTRILEVTGIHHDAFHHDAFGTFGQYRFSIAQRMSWAAKRKTTRIEDMAYCLMGIFDVNMPTLYGEGSKAFLRLQRKIMKVWSDHSIFAWKARDGSYPRGLLADSPAEFSHASNIRYDINSKIPVSPYSMTNIGLAMQLTLVPLEGQRDTFTALLRCKTHEYTVGIYLTKFKSASDRHFFRKDEQREIYVRVFPDMISTRYGDNLEDLHTKGKLKSVYVKAQFLTVDSNDINEKVGRNLMME